MNRPHLVDFRVALYESYCDNRDYGMSAERLRALFKGDTDRYEQMYREEQDKRKSDFEKVRGYVK